ncbi:cold shock domain-containing protein [Dactylosporangium sp. NPDC049140]|uniref:cold-shock protein n=1 Tax=Dactylosporangium sp. NPDC049140 TaxID=3155647 RepID=UPI0033C16DEC
MAVGTILRYDEIRGYGFIAPAGGGDDVFVHANDFGERRHQVHPGLHVEFEAEYGERGPKVSAVRLLEEAPAEPKGRTTSGDDEALCDVLTAAQFRTEVTEVLLQHVSTLTAAQVTQVRTKLVDHARAHGWVES